MDKRAKWALIAGVILLAAKKAVSINVKPGAVLSVLPEIQYARSIVAQVWAMQGRTATITSGTDGEHGSSSLHDNGLAEDYRTKDVTPDSLKILMVKDVRARLGTNYDVLLEELGQDNEHMHVEFDPK